MWKMETERSNVVADISAMADYSESEIEVYM